MGIRGLTTFIAKSPHKYLEHYELYDTYLVIDGNNIASHLYKWHCTRNDCFGGDYDKYAKVVYNFFKLLADCNVTPLVVFDGGYENRKIKTVYARMKSKVKYARNLNSVTQAGGTLFPIFLRDMFTEIVLKLELKTVRCDFEADYEMACLSKNLNCPILSYDSDFYVFDVLYIPFSSFEMNMHKVKHSNSTKYCISCYLYRIENFTRLYGGIKKGNIPLIGTLLGNDYIKSNVFRAFFSHIKLPKHKHVKSDQQKKIVGIIKWLQNETYDSAVTKILSRIKIADRKRVAEQIRFVSEGYLAKNSSLMPYLNIPVQSNKVEDSSKDFVPSVDQILDDAELECENNSADDESEISCSDRSETSDCESSECSLKSVESFKEMSNEEIPAWFIEKFRKCEYPSAFMDILTRNTYFCPPQLEDYSNICSHHISAVILSAINKILLSGTFECLVYVARSENATIKSYTTPPYDKKLPALSEIRNLSSENGKTVLFEILEFSVNDIKFIDSLPESWQLYILSMIYWIRNAKPKVAYCHVYSVILCMLALTKIDVEVGFYRSSTKFFKKFENTINNILIKHSTDTQHLTSEHPKFIESLQVITYDDCLLCLKEFISYFQMDHKMVTHLKLFDVHIVDCFAQFQSCLLHIKLLNTLLNKPFNNFILSDFYDGTFLFNMSVNLMKRNDVDAYITTFLKHCSTVLNCFKILIETLVKVLSNDIAVNNSNKRRRKKKKKVLPEIVRNDYCKDEKESTEEDGFDANNRFCLLKLAE